MAAQKMKRDNTVRQAAPPPPLPKCLLIANRGEIACRIIRTAKQLGIATVAIYTDADTGARHCRLADSSRRIGDYLNGKEIIATARAAGADAIHPGCGFLSERADFARLCQRAGILFVGPSPRALAASASKAVARQTAVRAGLPVVPGYDGGDNNDSDSDKTLIAAAKKITFPILIKATAGGGGRGMRVVANVRELQSQLPAARKEALTGFGSAAVILEKYIPAARHIEIQLVCDNHGNIMTLGERDCSLQRRHQKVVEECPAPNLPATTREKLHDWARQLAKAMRYTNIGTVEFLYDANTGNAYFLEVNARLQVEHPVTEMVYGADLVEWQLRLAVGDALAAGNDNHDHYKRHSKGCAIEARICAEDPMNDFLPTGGNLDTCRFPADGDAVRVDTGFDAGDRVGTQYDSMLAKIIAHGGTRDEAIDKLRAALAATKLEGVATNTGFVRALIGRREFRRGVAVTTTIAGTQDEWLATLSDVKQRLAVMAALRLFVMSPHPAPGFRLNAAAESIVKMRDKRDKDGGDWTIALQETTPDVYDVSVHVPGSGDDAAMRSEIRDIALNGTPHEGVISATFNNGDKTSAEYTTPNNGVWQMFMDGVAAAFCAPQLAAGGGGDVPDDAQAKSPMNAVVSTIRATVGDKVKKGDPLLTLEAMKMEITVVAGINGTVKALHCKVKNQVTQGQVLVELAADG